MKTNIHVRLAAEIVRKLAGDPARSNQSLADECGVSESHVRRYRSVLELSGLLAASESRVGADGRTRSVLAAF